VRGVSVGRLASQNGSHDFRRKAAEQRLMDAFNRLGVGPKELREFLRAEIERRKKREKGDEGA
jgi:hypothetical protein